MTAMHYEVTEQYKLVNEQLKCLIEDVDYAVTNYANASAQDKIQRIADVHQFPGHIACDCASRSEIVLPIHKNGEVIGVLDIDSPIEGRFSEADEEGLLAFVEILERMETGV